MANSPGILVAVIGRGFTALLAIYKKKRGLIKIRCLFIFKILKLLIEMRSSKLNSSFVTGHEELVSRCFSIRRFSNINPLFFDITPS